MSFKTTLPPTDQANLAAAKVAVNFVKWRSIILALLPICLYKSSMSFKSTTRVS